MTKERGRELAKLLLGASVFDELEARGVLPRFTLDLSDRADEIEGLIETLNQRRSHQNRLSTMGELGAGVVHELRNRVTSIRGFTDLARRSSVPADRQELLDRIFDQLEHGEESLAAFLGFVRRRGENGPFDVNDAVGEAAVLTRHQLQIHSVSLDTDQAENLPLAHGNARELTQVMVNLALNAQQAMPDGGGRVLFRTSVDDERRVVVQVADDGPGVPLESRERIFEPFFTTKSSDRGTGLGLAICSQLVSSWNGSLEVSDSDLGGALFTVRLALANSEGC